MSVNSTFVGSPAQLYGVVGTGNVVLASALPTTKAPVGHVFLTGYNASTTLFSQGQPSTADLSDWSDAGVVNGDVPVWNASLGMWTPGTAYVPSGPVLLEQHTANNTNQALGFTSWYSSAYDEYIIEIVNLIPASDCNIGFQASTNGVATKTDEYVPTINPTISAKAKLFNTSPP